MVEIADVKGAVTWQSRRRRQITRRLFAGPRADFVWAKRYLHQPSCASTKAAGSINHTFGHTHPFGQAR